MASISGTSSLGNTALRGFGGMASGIDRDSIIEQMTLGTTTKINNQKKAMQLLTWKQEAYRGVSDKIIDLADKYASYSSSSNLKDASVFSKNKITLQGAESSTRFVTATGSSSLLNNVALRGVERMATSTVRRSQEIVNSDLKTALEGLDKDFETSKLKGTRLVFTKDNGANNKPTRATFEFPSTYVDDDGKTKDIDYFTDNLEKLQNQLNKALEQSNIELDGKKLGTDVTFQVTDGKMTLTGGDLGGFKISGTALEGLGFSDKAKDGLTLQEFNDGLQNIADSYVGHTSAISGMTGKKLSFNYNGTKKSIELITQDEATELKGLSPEEAQKKMAENLQKRLDQAFGTKVIEVEFKQGENLNFKVSGADGNTPSLSITSGDSELMHNLGLTSGASNKINLSGRLDQAALKGELYNDDGTAKIKITRPNSEGKDVELDLSINGVKIEGLTERSSISEILSKINSTKAAGVKATYMDATGQFMLVSNETGANREINLDTELTQALFGQKGADGKYDEDEGVNAGKNALIHIDYGDGQDVTIERSSNTFNLEGLNVTVTGEFGGNWNDLKVTEQEDGTYKDSDGKDIQIEDGYKVDDNGYVVDDKGNRKQVWKADTSQRITFSAKADVDGAVEKVKSFFEDFNALVTEINTQVTTRPDSSYQPLTDEQKAEMDETSIENWEKKAKQGMLYGDSAMRDLSTDVQAIFTRLMENGASYEDLKNMGISYSEDYLDGGTLVFDEAKFREAMEKDPDKVSNIFTGGGNVKKGLMDVVDDAFTPYATRYASKNGNSYGRLVEIAGSAKKPTTLMSNQIYNQLKEMQNTIDTLNERLKTEQDRYISQFTTMETLLNKMNSQSSYLSQLG